MEKIRECIWFQNKKYCSIHLLQCVWQTIAILLLPSKLYLLLVTFGKLLLNGDGTFPFKSKSEKEKLNRVIVAF